MKLFCEKLGDIVWLIVNILFDFGGVCNWGGGGWVVIGVEFLGNIIILDWFIVVFKVVGLVM